MMLEEIDEKLLVSSGWRIDRAKKSIRQKGDIVEDSSHVEIPEHEICSDWTQRTRAEERSKLMVKSRY